MATTVSETKAIVESQAVQATDVRKLAGYSDLLSIFREGEISITEAKLQIGEAIVAFLVEQLDGLEGASRDTRRALLVSALSEDTGHSRSSISEMCQAAALTAWVGENVPQGVDGNPLPFISWRFVVPLLACVNRDRGQPGEVYVVNVHPDDVATFCHVLVAFTQLSGPLDKGRQALSDAGIRGLNGERVWVFLPKSAAAANSGGNALPDNPPSAPERDDVAGTVADCRKPGDYAGKAFSAVLACPEREQAFRSLGQQSAAYAVHLLAGLADTVVNFERDADGREMARRCLLAAEALRKACGMAFPKLVD